MKINALTTKIKLLQDSSPDLNKNISDSQESKTVENESHLIDFSEHHSTQGNDENGVSELSILTNKIEKIEQLNNKYKDTLKTLKERNSQLTTSLQIATNNYESKLKENEELKDLAQQLKNAQQEIQNLKECNEDLQNKVHACDFNQVKEIATLESDLQQAQEEISQLYSRIEVYTKREEEYAISLAENKLSIHKELEGKEAEIKLLKENLSTVNKEIQSLNIIISDYKQNISHLEDERNKLKSEVAELNMIKNRFHEIELEIKDLKQKCESQEVMNNRNNEELKCLELQTKQETAEKLAMIDRNNYLENRIKQISDENSKKNNVILKLEKEVNEYKEKEINDTKNKKDIDTITSEKSGLIDEINMWKEKYNLLEHEIQEERIELVKLQSEIEKLLRNHEMIQTENMNFRELLTKLESENIKLNSMKNQFHTFNETIKKIKLDLNNLQQDCISICHISKSLQEDFTKKISCYINEQLHTKLKNSYHEQDDTNIKIYKEQIAESKECIKDLKDKNTELQVQLLAINEKYLKNIEITNHMEKEIKELMEENKKSQDDKSIITSLEDNVLQLETNTSKLQTQLTQLNDDYEKKQEIIISLETDIEKLYNQNKLLQENNLDISSLQDNISNLTDKKSQLQAELLAINENVIKKDIIVQKLEMENKELLEQNNVLHKEHLDISLLQENITKIKEENCHLQAELLKLKENNAKQDHAIMNLEMEKETFIEQNKTLKDEILELKLLQENNKLSDNSLKETLKDIKRKLELTETTLSEIQILRDNLEIENKILHEKCERLKQDKESLHEKVLISEQKYLEYEGKITSLDNNEREKNSDLSKILCLQNNLKETKLELEQLKTMNESLTEQLNESMKTVKDNVESVVLKTKFNNVLTTNISESSSDNQKVTISQRDYSILNDDRNRLQSEIEGLQTHLQKVSKDNSILNDKLRDIISNSEMINVNEKQHIETSLLQEVNGLRNELEEEKQKLNDVLRENSLLAEKNLELQDCIQSQHLNIESFNKNVQYTSSKELEMLEMKEKYNMLLEIKMQLETKLAELELLGRSDDKNVQQLQEKNDKLKLVNEKLERKLDEALVSLRHFRALEESTELEYLRNILYEYLTGSGTHSETLAKVLSAVVKFDDKQTQLVLQKEKERQGLVSIINNNFINVKI